MNLEDDSKHDYFDGPDLPEEPRKEPKKPALSPDDPRYWEEPESEFEHLKPGNKGLIYTTLIGFCVVVALIVAAYFHWFAPAVDEASEFGYVSKIEQHKGLFKTYEGSLLPFKSIVDTTRVDEAPFDFSCKNGKVAVALRDNMLTNTPVRVSYRRYRSTLPWRGESRVVIDSVVPVDPARFKPADWLK